MTPYVSAKGIAFWRKPENSDKEHLHFVISETDVDCYVLIVNVTSFCSDESCVLDTADHPSIKHRSFIFYQKSFEEKLSEILTKTLGSHYRRVESLTQETLKRIQDGARHSAILPRKFKKHFANF